MNKLRLYIDIPYEDKSEALRLGARWSKTTKKWYIHNTISNVNEYRKFSKWLFAKSNDLIIATEFLFIAQGYRTCWRCRQKTKVAALGVGEFAHIFDNYNYTQCRYFDTSKNPGTEFHLAWAMNEHDIPPKLLQYLKKNFSVWSSYSYYSGRREFSNHCDHCGAVQGTKHLFFNPDSPFCLINIDDETEIENKVSKLKIIGIPILDDLLLKWNVLITDKDDNYIKYAAPGYLSLSNNKYTDYAKYNELYYFTDIRR